MRLWRFILPCILFWTLIGFVCFGQEKVDSLKQVEILQDFKVIQQQYVQTDSLQIKRLGVMEYLSSKFQAIEEKKKAKKNN